MDGNIEITKSNSYFYVDSLSNDMVVYTGTQNQHMLFGTQSNTTSHINMWFSNTTFNRLVNFSCNVTIGSNPTTGISNYTTLQTNNDFSLLGNNATWPLDHGGPALYMRYSQNGIQNASYIQSINRNSGTSNMLDMQIQASNLYIATGGVNANINVTFKPDGKVGIGTSNPSEILHTVGNMRITGLIAMNSNQPIKFGSNMVVGNAARMGFNLFGNSNFLDIYGGATSTSTGRQIYFWIDSNQTGGTNGMATFGGGNVFLNTGSLGIGTSNPLSRFHINSNALCYTLYTNNVNTNGIIMGLEDGTGGGQIWNGSNGGYIKIGTSNTERLKIAENGFIGIGVSNPVNLLHVHNVTSTTSNVIQMTNIGVGSNITNGFQLGQDQIGNIYLWNQQNAIMQFATTDIERMRITNTGAIGIGNIAPTTLLHMTSNTSNYITHTNISNSSGVMFGIEESSTGGGAVIWQSSNSYIKFGTNNIERLRVNSNGYIGIGTSLPIAKVSVAGYDGTNDPIQYGLLQLVQNATGAINGFHSNMASISIIRQGIEVSGLGYAKGQNIFGFGIGVNSNINFSPSILSMTHTGCIGINNSNPLTTIHALSNTYSFQFPGNQSGTSLSLYNSAGSPGEILFGVSNSLNNCATITFPYTAAGNNSNFMGLGTWGNNNTLVVTSATNVGIGTTSPVYKLDVNGSVNINKSSTNNNKLLVLFDVGGSSDSLVTGCNFYGFGINAFTLRYQSTYQHSFYTLSSNLMVVGAKGWTNVGIGTSLPTFTTDIWQQNSNTKMLRLTGDCYKNVTTYDPSFDDYSQFSISSCNNVTAGAYKVIMRVGVTNSNNCGFIQMVNPSVTQPPLCLQPNNGNVGINTSNPLYNLDVTGSIRSTVKIIGNPADTAAAPSFTWNGDTATGVYRIGTGIIGVSTGGVNRLTISSAGIAGIGTGLSNLNATNITLGIIDPSHLPDATTSVKGAVVLNTSNNSTSTTQAATPSAVKSAYDLANSALPKTGGTMTGDITMSALGVQYLGYSGDTASQPTYSWSGDSTTGIYRVGAGSIGVSTGGVNRLTISSSGLTGVGANLTNLNASYISTGVIASSHLPDANTIVKGAVLLSTSTSSTATTQAATPSAVKSAYDLANLALPKAGGTMTGDITMSGLGVQYLGYNADTVSQPTYSWSGDSSTGIYRVGAGNIGISSAGVNQMTIASNLVSIGAPFASYLGDILQVNKNDTSSINLTLRNTNTGASARTGMNLATSLQNHRYTYDNYSNVYWDGAVDAYSWYSVNNSIMSLESANRTQGFTSLSIGNFTGPSRLVLNDQLYATWAFDTNNYKLSFTANPNSGGGLPSSTVMTLDHNGSLTINDIYMRGLRIKCQNFDTYAGIWWITDNSAEPYAAKFFYNDFGQNVGSSWNWTYRGNQAMILNFQGNVIFGTGSGTGEVRGGQGIFNNDLYCYGVIRATSTGISMLAAGSITATAFNQSSDDRLKDDKVLITNALDTLKKLQPKTYNKHTFLPSEKEYGTSNDPIVRESGLVAQEVFYEAPELRHLVRIPEDADLNALYTISVPNSTDTKIDPVEYTKYWGTTAAAFNYTGIIPYLIGAVKELSDKVNSLTEEIVQLKKNKSI